jgi:hypothetical protein
VNRLFALPLLFTTSAVAAEPDAKLTHFREKVRPILTICVGCHSGAEPAGELTLTTRAGALKGGATGAALQPSDPEKSLLFMMASTKAMPPKRPLSDEQIAVLRLWVRDGAVWDGEIRKEEVANRAGLDWWSLQPVKRPAIPVVRDAQWCRNPIDHFVLAALEKNRLRPAPTADAATLLRRMTFDLTGLPPTRAELSAESQAAIERLLASPHYGERWGRHWLDVARYGESHGFERDQIRDHAWHYRDYVIRSFNADKPYPQFVKEQIAGDVLPGTGTDGAIATGFLVCGPWDEVGNTVSTSPAVKSRAREEELEDMLGTVGQTFLGMTVQCARCHNHKFDPIPQRDYYRLKAAFDGVRFGNRSLLSAEQQRERAQTFAALNAVVPDIEKRLNERAGGERVPRDRGEITAEESRRLGVLRAVDQSAQTWSAISTKPEPTFVFLRGDFEKKGEQVGAAALSAIGTPAPELGLSLDAPEGERRLRLAEWIADVHNPLTARVMVNRIWHWHFGQGLVRTPSDFGFNGERPSHPELLDWLAAEFIASGGSVKHMHRLILGSATYQQSATFNADAAAKDADNRLLWRFAPRRLEGEAVRDAMLSVSGQLNDDMGGPGFRPFTVTIFNSHFYTLTDPTTREFNRRTVYRIHVQSAKSPLLEAFDCPDPGTKTPRRASTTTPMQALALMNNAFVMWQAKFLGERLQREAGADVTQQVQLAYQLALGRSPAPDEAARAAALVRDHGAESLAWTLFNASEFFYLR